MSERRFMCHVYDRPAGAAGFEAFVTVDHGRGEGATLLAEFASAEDAGEITARLNQVERDRSASVTRPFIYAPSGVPMVAMTPERIKALETSLDTDSFVTKAEFAEADAIIRAMLAEARDA